MTKKTHDAGNKKVLERFEDEVDGKNNDRVSRTTL